MQFLYGKTGDGSDEEVAARQMNFPFWRVERHQDLMALNAALEKELI